MHRYIYILVCIHHLTYPPLSLNQLFMGLVNLLSSLNIFLQLKFLYEIQGSLTTNQYVKIMFQPF